MSPRLQNFEQAFSSHGGGCRRACECGKEFYNPDNGYTWEDGEIEGLEKAGAIALPHTVTTIHCEGREYVTDCDCWHERAEKIMDWLDSHGRCISEWFALEKKRKQKEADASPVVTP